MQEQQEQLDDRQLSDVHVQEQLSASSSAQEEPVDRQSPMASAAQIFVEASTDKTTGQEQPVGQEQDDPIADRVEEKRVDPADGDAYTYAELLSRYPGKKKTLADVYRDKKYRLRATLNFETRALDCR